MEENEFYFEETNPKKVQRICLGIIILLMICTLLFVHYRRTYTLNIKKNIVYEVGSTISTDLTDYIENKIIDKSDYNLNLSEVAMDDGVLVTTGEYTYKVRYKNITKKGKIIVRDTVPPVVETTDLTVGVNEDFSLDEFLTNCEDLSKPCLVTYKKESDEKLVEKAGTYAVDILISDSQNNRVTKTVKLTVKEKFSREEMKRKDRTIDHIKPDYEDWNKSMFITLEESLDEHETENDEDYNYLLDLNKYTLATFLPEEYKNNNIAESEVLLVYNKYNYVIGYSIRIVLDNQKVIYLTK